MDKGNGKRWYVVSPDNAPSELETILAGLSSEEVESRLEQYVPNRIESGGQVSSWKILLHQFTSPLIYIQLAAMVVTLAIQHWTDAIVIGAVIVINTVIGFIQENRAENAIQALIRLTEPKANVRRNGQEKELDSSNLVPGDIVLLDEGNIVPADLRIPKSMRLQIDESLLTGESVPSPKFSEPYPEDSLVTLDDQPPNRNEVDC